MKFTTSGSTRTSLAWQQTLTRSSMEARKATREQAWSVGGWSDTVQQVSHSHCDASSLADQSDGQVGPGNAVGYLDAHVVQSFEVVERNAYLNLGW